MLFASVSVRTDGAVFQAKVRGVQPFRNFRRDNQGLLRVCLAFPQGLDRKDPRVQGCAAIFVHTPTTVAQHSTPMRQYYCMKLLDN